MKPRPLPLSPGTASWLAFVPAWVLFVLALVWPTIALIARSITSGEAPTGGFTFSARQIGLLWRSVWLSGVATGLCLCVSLPGVYVIGRMGRFSQTPLIVALLMALLLCPPMVYAFGWERLLPTAIPGAARCIGVWALWAWPIPALLIGAGWWRVGHSAHEEALLVASPTSAFLRVALPLLRRHIGLSAIILFALFFSDYGVPHACGLLVYATELLGWAASSNRLIDTVWPATLSVAVTVVVLALIFIQWRGCAVQHEYAPLESTRPTTSRSLTLIAAGCFAISWLLPIGVLMVKLVSPQGFMEALRVYAADLGFSLAAAILGGAAVAGMGLGIAATPVLRRVGLVWAVLFGALPGALIGEALIAAYNLQCLRWLYDYWPIVALSYVARFGWIGVLTATLALASAPPDIVSQARTDGATRGGVLRHVQIPASLPALWGGVAVVAALSLADVATSSLVRIPAFNPIAHVLIEKFHRFEDDMLISLSLWLVIASLPGAILVSLAVKRRWA